MKSESIFDIMTENLDDSDLEESPEDVAKGVHAARMAMWTSMSYLREHLGDDEAEQSVRDLLGRQLPAVAVEPAPAPAAPAVPIQEAHATLQGRAKALLDLLDPKPPIEADLEARAAIWSGAAYLRARQGEGSAVGFLRAIEAAMSQLATLDRWQPPEGGAN